MHERNISEYVLSLSGGQKAAPQGRQRAPPRIQKQTVQSPLSTTGNTVVPELTQSMVGGTEDYSESDLNADDVDTTHDNDKPKHPRQLGGRISKHIPKGARFACSKALTSFLLAICENPERVAPWRELLWFTFNFGLLGQPPRAGRRRNLANIIKKRLDRRH